MYRNVCVEQYVSSDATSYIGLNKKYMHTMHTKALSHGLESFNPLLGFDYITMCPFSEATLRW